MSYPRNDDCEPRKPNPHLADRELLSATDTLKLFTFRRSPLEPELGSTTQGASSYSASRSSQHPIDSANTSMRSEGEISTAETSRPTAEELMQMLSRKKVPSSAGAPPIPPKPRRLEESQSRDQAGRAFKSYFSIKNKNSSPNDSRLIRELNSSDNDLNEQQQTVQPDNIGLDMRYQPGVSVLTVNTAPREEATVFLQQQQQLLHKSPVDYAPFVQMTDSDVEVDSYNHTIKPIVTESPEEANNNSEASTAECRNLTNKGSTVEILEVPLKHKKYDTYGNSNSNSTFSKWQRQQQLFYENNPYPVPVVTSATDDEEDQIGSYNKAQPTDIEVHSILSHSTSSKQQPPRTSTPNNSHRNINDSASADSSTATNNDQTIGHDADVNIDNFHEEDFANTSKDTDELTNTSALNQSGGGELIGVSENSDSANNSKNSHDNNSKSDSKMPYTIQMLEETSIYSSQTPSRFGNSNRSHAPNTTHDGHEECQNKIEKLEKLTASLTGYIEDLKLQVSDLASKVSILEVSDRQVESSNAHNMTFDSPATSQAKFTPSGDTNYPPHSDSTTKMLSTSMLNNGLDSMSTYSRKNVATISRNPNKSLTQNGDKHLGNSLTRRFASTQSCNTSSVKSRKQMHASTNSIYADNLKTGENSNYLNQRNRQTVSPNSLMSLSSHRDQSACASMLSLSSIGQHSNASTLKKASALSGSVSNMSQIGSQISNWPSMSEFVTTEHRARDLIYSDEERLIRMVLYNRLITMRVPNWVEYDYDIDKVLPAPSVSLKLDWVHGYRGKDCRSNIYFLPTGECIYFVASVVVLYNPDERKQRHYLGHTETVKCLAIHPNRLIVATGQSAVQNRRDKRPIVRVWNTVNLNTLRIIGFNEDLDGSICCLAFSKHDQGATLAVVDESNEHTITLLDWNKEKNWRIGEANSGHEPVLAIDFHPIDKYSLVAVGRSTINFWDTRGMTLSKKTGLFDKYDKPKFVLCLTFNDQGDTITGDSNGNLIIWPRGSYRPSRVIHDCHQGGVFSVLAMKDGSYLTGGRDRRIVEWDESFSRTGREAELPEHCGGVRFITYARGSQVLIGTLRNSILMGSLDDNFQLIMQGHAELTSSLAIHPKYAQYLTGGFDEQIHLFDSTSHSVIWSKCLTMPASAACFSPNGLMLVVGSTQGKWLVIDTMSKEILFTNCDGTGTINCIKFSPNGDFFAMGSYDANIYVYQTTEMGNKFCRVGACVGHSAPVKELDWSEDSRYLQTQSMNFELMFWKAHNCRPLEDEKIIDDLKWFTHNCTIGFSVIGIWSDSIDSALINHCDKSSSQDLMVSVTDTGTINVFNWPPYYGQCLSQKYFGNVEKFNFVKFLCNDSKLIAIGAKNCVTTEWTIDRGCNQD